MVDHQGLLLGRIYQRFGIFTKKFDIADAQGNVLMTMRSGFFSFWTFPIVDVFTGQQKAIIKKKWSGLFKEMFLDPHFCNKSKCGRLIARFEPTSDGWKMATEFAKTESMLK